MEHGECVKAFEKKTEYTALFRTSHKTQALTLGTLQLKQELNWFHSIVQKIKYNRGGSYQRRVIALSFIRINRL